MTEDGRSVGLWVALAVAGVVGLLLVTLVAIPIVGSFAMETGQSQSGGTSLPPGSFGADDSEPVTFTRTGEPVDASLVAISVNGDRIGTWEELQDGNGTVTDGERLVVTQAEVGDEVALVWLDGDEPRILMEVTVTRAIE